MQRFMLFLLGLAICAAAAPLSGQPVGFTDSFTDQLRALPHPYFNCNQRDGVLQVSVRVPQGAKWQGFTYEIGDTIDISAKPIMNLRLKSDFSFLLTAYLFDTNGMNQTVSVKVQASGTFTNYFLDFSAAYRADKQRIHRLQFTPNGNSPDGCTGQIWLDELKIGHDAGYLAGIGAVMEKNFFVGSINNRFTIVDLAHSLLVTAEGGAGSLDHLSVSAVSGGQAVISFDCVPDFIGRDTLLITAHGSEGFDNNTILAPIFIQDNAAPTLDPLHDLTVQVGDTVRIALTGISDGDKSVEQPVQITVACDQSLAFPDDAFTIRHAPAASSAELIMTARTPAQKALVTLTCNDGFQRNNLTQRSFLVDAYQEYNQPPTLDPIVNQFVYLQQGRCSVKLTGISDGDDGSQTLSFHLASSDTTIVPIQQLMLNHISGSATADLHFTPLAVGQSLITLTVTDNGGAPGNNGHAAITRTFMVQCASLPPTGLQVAMNSFQSNRTLNLAKPGDWKVEDINYSQKVEYGSFHGRDHVIKLTLTNKTCWTGLWHQFDELNLENNRYLCYDIYFEGSSFSNGGKTHSYFWDAEEKRNLPAGHSQRKTVPVNQWRTVFMDYRGSTGMNTDQGEPLNLKRINRVLINYASNFDWPFPVDKGTVYLANIKLGGAVPDSLVPATKPGCAIDAIADQTLFSNSGQLKVRLSGISSGAAGSATVTITAVSSKPEFLNHPVVSAVAADGTAELSYTSPGRAGTAAITVKVAATGSVDATRAFTITVVDAAGADVATVALDVAKHYQTIRGFGAFQFEERQNYIYYYTEDLGASSVRLGLIGNQIEPVNDNEDPGVLDMSALNTNAFDFNFYRQLKAGGVETFILTSWSPPAWMKRNLAESHGYAEAPDYSATDNVLEPYYYEEFAESMSAAVRLFQDRAGIDLYAIGPQNEPAFNEPYPSAVLSPVKYAELVEVIGEKFAREGLQTKLYMPEQVFTQDHYAMAHYINALLARPAADHHTDIIATHGYAEDGVGQANPTFQKWTELWNNSQRCLHPKELWMTETYPEYRNWHDAFALAGAIHGALVYGQVSLWNLWDMEGTLMYQGKPTASFYTSKHYYKFIRPGAVRIQASAWRDGLLTSAFLDVKNSRVTAVCINNTTLPMLIRIAGDSLPEAFDLYQTEEYVNFAYRGVHFVGADVLLPANSVSTLVGQYNLPTATANTDAQIPLQCELLQNYPNPFNPMTYIEFRLQTATDIDLTVYGLLGQKVKTLAQGVQASGNHRLRWDGQNESGHPAASGVYFIRLKSPHYVKTIKTLLLK